MKKIKNELLFIVSIMLTIFIIIISYISWTTFGEGSLVFWIKNYNPPCNTNNTTQCTHEAFRFSKILLDHQKEISGNGTVHGGQTWKIELKLSDGVHSISVMDYNSGSTSFTGIKIETNKITCRQLPFWNNLSVQMAMPDFSACPP